MNKQVARPTQLLSVSGRIIDDKDPKSDYIRFFSKCYFSHKRKHALFGISLNYGHKTAAILEIRNKEKQ